MTPGRDGAYLRALWLAHWYATGVRAMALPPSHARAVRDGSRA